jgi:hypothetical protein
MRDIDRLYMRYQFYGAPRLTVALRAQGQVVNEKRVARLMRVMGIQAIVPGPHTSRPHPAHRVFPYLLRGLLVSASNTHLIPLRSLRHTNAASPLCLFVQPKIRSFVMLQSRRTPLHAGFVSTGDSVRRRRAVQLLHLGIIAVDRLHGAGLQSAGATAASRSALSNGLRRSAPWRAAHSSARGLQSAVMMTTRAGKRCSDSRRRYTSRPPRPGR